jgi:NADH:ubiquinone oxidoreductase subunit E
VGRYVIALCTNIACMLSGAFDLLEHAEELLGGGVGQTTTDGMFTLEEAECLAGCDAAPCVQVNHRFFGPVRAGEFDALIDDLTRGALDGTVPPHGVLNRVERTVGLLADGTGADR